MWYKEEKRAHRINHGVRGSHASILFQCKERWMLNLERCLPAFGLDDLYIMCICRANLDAMGVRAASTIGTHVTAVKCTVQNCSLI
jgi:hypothetical protein